MPASNPPAPPSKCPVMDFVELTGTFLARSPKTLLRATVSRTSPMGVEVPCAFAKLSPDDISYLNAHGTSTPIGDVRETVALKRVFGERAKKVPVSSTKSMTGHLLGGAGGLEAGISVLALRDQILPPTINYETPDPECDLDYVPNHARKAPVEYALSNSFGFGGTNAALIFKRWSGK